MGRQKGTEKTGGRQKGTENKITKSLRVRFEEFVQSEFSELEIEFSDLKKSEEYKKMSFEEKFNVIINRYNLITKMSGFVIPKKQENSVDTENIKKIAGSMDKINSMFK